MPAYVKSATNGASGFTNTLAATFGSSTTSGNAIVVGVQSQSGGADLTVTDNKSNTYTLMGTYVSVGGRIGVFVALNATGGASHIVTVTDSTSSLGGLIASEFSGVASTYALDGYGTGTGSGGTFATSSWTTVNASDVIIGYAAISSIVANTWTAGSGFTTAGTAGGTGAGTAYSQMMEYKVVASTGSQTATATSSVTNQAQGIIGIALASATVPTPPTTTTQAVSSVDKTTATANGNITLTGSATPTVRGFVYGTSSVGTTPGNVAPGSSGYSSSASDSGSYSTGAYTKSLTGLAKNTTYYLRSYAQNSAGYSYGSEVTFTTLPGTPLIDAVSGVNLGFTDVTDGTDTDPFDSGDQISYTVQSPLPNGTYYYRVRLKDVTGKNTYTAWSAVRTLVVSSVSATGSKKISTGVSKPVKVKVGASWVTKPLKRYNGSTWVTTP